MVAKRSTKKRVTELESFMEQTNGGGSPENVEGFNFFRAATAGFRQETLFGPTVLRDRPDGGFFSDAGPSADDGRVPGPMSEKVIGYDNRARIGETAMLPWRCICHLEVQYDRGPVGFGTGFIAGENLLLTAAHVLVDRGAYGWQENVGGAYLLDEFPVALLAKNALKPLEKLRRSSQTSSAYK